MNKKRNMWTERSRAERLIYKHASSEAYKAKKITLAVRKADPRALLLPGREGTWLRYVIAKRGCHQIKRTLPDLEEATRLHPPINALVKELYKGVDTKGARPEIYYKWVKNVIKEWNERGCPTAGPQLINDTLILIEGKKDNFFSTIMNLRRKYVL